MWCVLDIPQTGSEEILQHFKDESSESHWWLVIATCTPPGINCYLLAKTGARSLDTEPDNANSVRAFYVNLRKLMFLYS